jgi:hypothetical protein
MSQIRILISDSGDKPAMRSINLEFISACQVVQDRLWFCPPAVPWQAHPMHGIRLLPGMSAEPRETDDSTPQ